MSVMCKQSDKVETPLESLARASFVSDYLKKNGKARNCKSCGVLLGKATKKCPICSSKV